MAKINRFEDIEAWQLAAQFDVKLFSLIEGSKIARDYGLKDQMLRASGSIMDNIAEGFGRMGNKEFGQFLSYAYGSCDEVKSQLYRAKNRNYISEEERVALYNEADKIGAKVFSLMKYLRQSGRRGTRSD